MDQETWKAIRIRHSYTEEYLGLLIFAALFSGLALESLYADFRNGGWKFVLFFLAADSVVITWLILLTKKMKTEGAEKRHIPPYRVSLNDCTVENLTERLKEYLGTEPLAPGISTAYITGSKSILFIEYEFSIFPGKKQLAEVRNKMTSKARAKYGLKETMPVGVAKRSHRINIFVFGDTDAGIEDLANMNACQGMSRPETVLNIYICLSSRQILIPAYCSWYNGGSARYVFCVETLDEIIKQLSKPNDKQIEMY